MEERRSLADGEEEEDEDEEEDEEEDDMSPQKLRTIIKEGIEVAIHPPPNTIIFMILHLCQLERQKYS